jgi:hypothetical protein
VGCYPCLVYWKRLLWCTLNEIAGSVFLPLLVRRCVGIRLSSLMVLKRIVENIQINTLYNHKLKCSNEAQQEPTLQSMDEHHT